MQLAQKKLQFHYFLSEQILARFGFECHRKNHIRLKFSNKFMPSTLPRVGPLMDSLMVQEEKVVRQE